MYGEPFRVFVNPILKNMQPTRSVLTSALTCNIWKVHYLIVLNFLYFPFCPLASRAVFYIIGRREVVVMHRKFLTFLSVNLLTAV